MFRIFIDYPSPEEEQKIVTLTTGAPGSIPNPVITRKELLEIPALIRALPVSEHVVRYAVKLTRKSRPQFKDSPEFVREWVSWGAGPRAAQYLVLGAKANAVLRGSFNVASLDVRAVADPVLNHRILTNFNAEAEGIDSREVIRRLVEFVQE
jgi:MoxR-like ATPase